MFFWTQNYLTQFFFASIFFASHFSDFYFNTNHFGFFSKRIARALSVGVIPAFRLAWQMLQSGLANKPFEFLETVKIDITFAHQNTKEKQTS